jgi:hypothetical protein
MTLIPLQPKKALDRGGQGHSETGKALVDVPLSGNEFMRRTIISEKKTVPVRVP